MPLHAVVMGGLPIALAGGSSWLRRIAQEQSSLSTSLPCTWRSSIFLAVDSARVDVLRCAACTRQCRKLSGWGERKSQKLLLHAHCSEGGSWVGRAKCPPVLTHHTCPGGALHAHTPVSKVPEWGSKTSSCAGALHLSWDAPRALITGPEDTPYANGCFLFDIHLTPEYPNQPPKVLQACARFLGKHCRPGTAARSCHKYFPLQVQFLTTGGGRVR